MRAVNLRSLAGRLPNSRRRRWASAIVKALQDGVEDVYLGELGQAWLGRWRDNPTKCWSASCPAGEAGQPRGTRHMNQLLATLVAAPTSGRIRIIDLTQTLSPDFPLG
jgi:hypothetical protein